jgi:hypothetical protein
MSENTITVGAIILAGVLIGLFFSPTASGVVVISLLVLGVIGLIGAVFLNLIQQEWLYLLMAAIPVAGIVLAAAISSSLAIRGVKLLRLKSSKKAP